jgi:hypothetical protein
MRGSSRAALLAVCICCASVALAAESVSYSYDALGRMTKVQVAGGPANGVQRSYLYDAANNRTGLGFITITPPSSVSNVTSAGAVIGITLPGALSTGMVTFTENGVFLGSAYVYNGQASILLEGFALGTHTITAAFSGDGINAPFSQTFTVRVQNLSWLPAVLQILLE